jgi:flagellar hook-associated protein 2
MGSPITLSGFNNIDFNAVLNALMAQASIPLNALQAKQTALRSQASSLASLSSKFSNVRSAAQALAQPDGLNSVTASSSDASAVSVSAAGSAPAGHYDVVVRELARTQVMASQSAAPDADTTAIATAGLLRIGGVNITVTQPVTLRKLAEAINASDAPVSATVVKSGPGEFRLVLTASASGTANAFTVTNELSGGAGIAFHDADGNGVSGDSSADNAVQATDANVLINNVTVTGSSNVLEGAVPDVTLTLHKRDPGSTVHIDVTATSAAVKNRIADFISAYNSLTKLLSDQSAGTGSIGNNPMVRAARHALRQSLLEAQTTDGAFTTLSQIGIEFTRTGSLALNERVFDAAIATNAADVKRLLAGTDTSAFTRVAQTIDEYTKSSGLLSQVKDRLDADISRLGTQIDAMTDRLSKQRATMQREFVAAERAMTRLKNQSGSLSSLSNNLSVAF